MKRAGKKAKSRIVSFRIDEDDFALLDAAAPTKKGSCEMQRYGVEMQVGDPNAV